MHDLLIDRAKVQNTQESRIPHEVEQIVEKKFINSKFTFGQEIVENQHLKEKIDRKKSICKIDDCEECYEDDDFDEGSSKDIVIDASNH